MDKTIQVLEGQSVLDIAVQTAGSVEGAIGLAIRNGISITDDLDILRKIDEAEEIDRRIRDYYRKREIKPSTGIAVTDHYQIFEETFINTFQ